MMNRRTWIAGITATILLAASLAACKQEQQGEETGQAPANICCGFMYGSIWLGD